MVLNACAVGQCLNAGFIALPLVKGATLAGVFYPVYSWYFQKQNLL